MNYIYTRSYPPCSYCTRVKALLDAYGIPYEEYDINDHDNLLITDRFYEQGFKSVPQVFLNNKHIGGFEATAAFLRKPSEGSTTYEVK
jgi:glutaredoxin